MDQKSYESYVYIIQSQSTKRFYIGASENPERRIKEHNFGKVKATKNKGPWILKFSQMYSSIKEAKQVEYKLKKLKRRDYLERVIQDRYIKLR